MTKQEYEQKIKELENQIAELKNAKVEDRVWKPKKNEDYWYVNTFGGIECWRWYNRDVDNFAYEQGNCFKTEEEAEEHLKKLTIQGKFKTYVREHSDELDWEDTKQQKWCVYFGVGNKVIRYMDCSNYRDMFNICASSGQILRDAIEYIGGEEVAKKYLFD